MPISYSLQGTEHPVLSMIGNSVDRVLDNPVLGVVFLGDQSKPLS